MTHSTYVVLRHIDAELLTDTTENIFVTQIFEVVDKCFGIFNGQIPCEQTSTH